MSPVFGSILKKFISRPSGLFLKMYVTRPFSPISASSAVYLVMMVLGSVLFVIWSTERDGQIGELSLISPTLIVNCKREKYLINLFFANPGNFVI